MAILFMKVLLLQDIRNLGKKGDIKEVSNGYARNFLLAQKKAAPATEENLNVFCAEAEKKSKVEKQRLEALKKLANQLNGVVLEFEEKADEKGKLFGGISDAQIVSALNKKGLLVEKRQIELPRAFKQTGRYSVKIELSQEMEIFIKIEIKSKK